MEMVKLDGVVVKMIFHMLQNMDQHLVVKQEVHGVIMFMRMLMQKMRLIVLTILLHIKLLEHTEIQLIELYVMVQKIMDIMLKHVPKHVHHTNSLLCKMVMDNKVGVHVIMI